MSDGRMLVVNRTMIQQRMCEGMKCTWGRLREKIDFVDWNGTRVVWEQPLKAFLLDWSLATGWIVLGRAGFPDEKRLFNAEMNPYVFFVLETSGWNQRAFDGSLIGREANMLMEVNGEQGERKKVTLEDKRQRNTNPHLQESYKRVSPDSYLKGR